MTFPVQLPLTGEPTNQNIPMLQDIQRRLSQLEAEVRAIKAVLSTQAAPRVGQLEKRLLSHEELLADERNDPEVRRDPPRWTGPSYVGQKYSHCPPDWLRAEAAFRCWKAEMADKEGKVSQKNGRPISFYERLDERRAISWALVKDRQQPQVTFPVP